MKDYNSVFCIEIVSLGNKQNSQTPKIQIVWYTKEGIQKSYYILRLKQYFINFFQCKFDEFCWRQCQKNYETDFTRRPNSNKATRKQTRWLAN